ncbi:MAG: DUF4260 family protein [Balneola sp.]
MKYVLKSEQLVLFFFTVIFFPFATNLPWYFYAGLFFTPDLAFIGYAINSKVGAILYNILHHQGIWMIVALIGFSTGTEWLLGLGITFVGHSAFDRIFGYGLKYFDSFHNTHLGIIGNNKK